MFLERLRAAQTALAAEPFDLFVTGSPSSVEYLSGYRSMASRIYEESDVVVLLTADKFVLVLPRGQVAAALDSGVPVDQVIAFGEFHYFGDPRHPAVSAPWQQDFADAIREARIILGPAKRIGLDRTRLTVKLHSILQSSGHERMIDATNWIGGVRAIKLPREIELLKKSALASERGIQRAFDQAGRGITEREVAKLIAATMVEEGAEPAFLSVQTGHRGGLVDAYPSDKAWAPGEFLRVDVGCIVEGYWSDIARTAVLGEPDSEQTRSFEALRIGQQFELDNAAPGMVAKDLFAQTRTVIRENGIPDFERHHCGHGIGLSIYDSPGVTDLDETPIAEGMVLCLEVPYYALGQGGILTEDTVLITSDGCTSFTSLPRELRIIADA
jgi:Xaa-Pro aminopeptidase